MRKPSIVAQIINTLMILFIPVLMIIFDDAKPNRVVFFGFMFLAACIQNATWDIVEALQDKENS